MTRFEKAADGLLVQLLVWHKLHAYHVEVNDSGEFLDTRDFWSPADQAAVDEYQEAKAELLGQVPLFPKEKSA